jgi:hypothetical protein
MRLKISGHLVLIGCELAKAQRREFCLDAKKKQLCLMNRCPGFLNRCLADYLSGDLDARLSCYSR